MLAYLWKRHTVALRFRSSETLLSFIRRPDGRSIGFILTAILRVWLIKSLLWPIDKKAERKFSLKVVTNEKGEAVGEVVTIIC